MTTALWISEYVVTCISEYNMSASLWMQWNCDFFNNKKEENYPPRPVPVGNVSFSFPRKLSSLNAICIWQFYWSLLFIYRLSIWANQWEDSHEEPETCLCYGMQLLSDLHGGVDLSVVWHVRHYREGDGKLVGSSPFGLLRQVFHFIINFLGACWGLGVCGYHVKPICIFFFFYYSWVA